MNAGFYSVLAAAQSGNGMVGYLVVGGIVVALIAACMSGKDKYLVTRATSIRKVN